MSGQTFWYCESNINVNILATVVMIVTRLVRLTPLAYYTDSKAAHGLGS